MRRFWKFVILGILSLFLIGCNANPNSTDVQRVKDDFLRLRFQSIIQPRFSGYNDQQLFELACKNNNVKCNVVRQMLKESDPDFYGVLESGQ